MAAFKVGDRVEHYGGAKGTVVEIRDRDSSPIGIKWDDQDRVLFSPASSYFLRVVGRPEMAGPSKPKPKPGDRFRSNITGNVYRYVWPCHNEVMAWFSRDGGPPISLGWPLMEPVPPDPPASVLPLVLRDVAVISLDDYRLLCDAKRSADGGQLCDTKCDAQPK